MKNPKNKIKLLLMFALIFASFQVEAQKDEFSIATQFRVRPEFRSGYRTLATDSSMPAFSVGQRTRLMFKYHKDNITFFSSIQDSRVWGDEEKRKDIGGLQVNQLWTELDLNKGYALKLGRQELVYDDARLLGNVAWANLTISHDAFVLKYNNKKEKLQWHLGGAYNQAKENIFTTTYGMKNYKALGFAWLKKGFNKKHSISAIAIADAYESASPTSNKLKATITAGPIYNYKHKTWQGLIGAYYQAGKTNTDLDVSAFMINAYVQKSMRKLSLGLGYDYLSGNDDKTKATESNNFNTLYATNHKFYGYMDYFLNIPNDTKQRGLQDLYAKIGYKINDEWNAGLAVHNFAFANENNLGLLKINKSIGTEADFIINYKPSPLIKLQGGYSMMFANNNLELVKGGDASAYNGWAFVMLTVSPTLFKH